MNMGSTVNREMNTLDRKRKLFQAIAGCSHTDNEGLQNLHSLGSSTNLQGFQLDIDVLSEGIEQSGWYCCWVFSSTVVFIGSVEKYFGREIL